MVHVILDIALAVLCLVTGRKFARGKWVRLVAGNTFKGDDELRTEQALREARMVAPTCYAAAVLCVSIAAFAVLEMLLPRYAAIGGVLAFASFVLLLYITLRAILRINRARLK